MEREIEVKDKIITIHQDFDYGYAGEIWDAALVLTHFIIKEKSQSYFDLKDKIVLELGAGTGICGLAASILGPKIVYLTDRQDNVPLLSKNLEANKNIITSEVKVLPLDWNNENDYIYIKETIDYIIASDVIWNMNYFDSLLNTINHFYTDNTIVLLSYTYRKQEDVEFFKVLKERGWNIEKVPDELYDETYKSDDIFILTMKRF